MLDKIYINSLRLFIIGKITILCYSISNYDNNIVYIYSLINYFLIFISMCINIYKLLYLYNIEYYTREFLFFIFITETIIFILSCITIVYFSDLYIEHKDKKYTIFDFINWSLWLLPTYFTAVIIFNYSERTNILPSTELILQ